MSSRRIWGNLFHNDGVFRRGLYASQALISSRLASTGRSATVAHSHRASQERSIKELMTLRSDASSPDGQSVETSSMVPTLKTFRDVSLEEVLVMKEKHSRKVHEIDESATVFDAIRAMKTLKIGALLVRDKNGELSGIFSERDYLNKIAVEGRNSRDTTVASVMTKNVQFADVRYTTSQCLEVMNQGRFRHLPVKDRQGRVAGLVSIKDLVSTVLTHTTSSSSRSSASTSVSASSSSSVASELSASSSNAVSSAQPDVPLNPPSSSSSLSISRPPSPLSVFSPLAFPSPRSANANPPRLPLASTIARRFQLLHPTLFANSSNAPAFAEAPQPQQTRPLETHHSIDQLNQAPQPSALEQPPTQPHLSLQPQPQPQSQVSLQFQPQPQMQHFFYTEPQHQPQPEPHAEIDKSLSFAFPSSASFSNVPPFGVETEDEARESSAFSPLSYSSYSSSPSSSPSSSRSRPRVARLAPRPWERRSLMMPASSSSSSSVFIPAAYPDSYAPSSSMSFESEPSFAFGLLPTAVNVNPQYSSHAHHQPIPPSTAYSSLHTSASTMSLSSNETPPVPMRAIDMLRLLNSNSYQAHSL